MKHGDGKDAKIQNGNLYHGAEPYDPNLIALEVGQKIETKHFFSTTPVEYIALRFSDPDNYDGKGYVMVLDKENYINAVNIVDFSKYHEVEYLMQSGQEFEVTSIEWRQNVTIPGAEKSGKGQVKPIYAFVHVKPVN